MDHPENIPSVPPVLDVRALTKRYGNLTALNKLNLTLPAGKIIGLLGPNGSGKTTLIKIIAGILTPTSGEVTVNGYPIGIESKKIVSYLPERTYFDESQTVEQVMAYFEDFYDDFRPERAEEMFKRLSIDPKRKIKTLSKGTKEKVQLVMVMSRTAKLYLLDEPIAGVDPAARDYILDTIISNYDSEATVLISTHLIQDIEKVLDEFVFIRNGEVVLQDTAAHVREEQGKTVDELFREAFRC